jgi:MurNAc alpha-1-phosphate uridylyltransferase
MAFAIISVVAIRQSSGKFKKTRGIDYFTGRRIRHPENGLARRRRRSRGKCSKVQAMQRFSSPTAIKAMILSAGRGERMRPLTDHCPKPLLPVRGQPLIEWHAQALARGGFSELVINTAWLGEQLEQYFETRPQRPGQAPLSVEYSHEGQDFGYALETAGGISRALPLLGDIFWVLAGDVFVPGFEFSQAAVSRFEASGKQAHLWLVPNPPHNPRGDFGLSDDGLALNLPPDDATPCYTYSTIGLYRRALFDGLSFGNQQGLATPLAPLLRAAMDRSQVSAELYEGAWTDVGTPARLAELNQPIFQSAP